MDSPLVMGREPVDIHMDKKSNGVIVSSNGSSSDMKIHVSPRISKDNIEVGEVKECTEQTSASENTHERQDVLGVKSTNFDGKNEKPGSQKSNDVKKLNSPSFKSRGNANHTVPKPFALATEKRASSMTRHVGVETVNSSGTNANSLNSPTASRGSQPNSPLTARKSSEYKKHLDEEDSWSVASSSAKSVKTVKPKVTIGVAPTFRSSERSERRKEFYQKLEEKHQALDTERKENEQRLKEEQEAAIKQLRKSMSYKANPVPNFYYEGPPSKVELKKLPLTRAMSPNLNRRKSCSDAINSSSQDEKGKQCSRQRHSVEGCKEEAKPTNSTRFKVALQINSPRNPKNNKDNSKISKGTPRSVRSGASGKITKEEKIGKEGLVAPSDNVEEETKRGDASEATDGSCDQKIGEEMKKNATVET